MTHSGVAQMVADRGASVGVDLHPHALRHYAIDQMLRSGLSEGDCMRVTGHSTRAMLDRYAAALGAERADEAFRAIVAGSGPPCCSRNVSTTGLHD